MNLYYRECSTHFPTQNITKQIKLHNKATAVMCLAHLVEIRLDGAKLCQFFKSFRMDSSKRSLTPVGNLWPWNDLQHDQKLRFPKKLLPSKFHRNRTRLMLRPQSNCPVRHRLGRSLISLPSARPGPPPVEIKTYKDFTDSRLYLYYHTCKGMCS